uniref:G-protein coupled receptors family 1 profile domain-containing protein n=1 Tax=Maylandia zebra TaxID=106582 RepID=A0A3P9DP27_9CICH
MLLQSWLLSSFLRRQIASCVLCLINFLLGSHLLILAYQVPVIYYTNLIISILIHHSMMFCMMVLRWYIMHDTIACFLYYFSVTASLYFRLCIALERYCFIACPLLDCLRQTRSSVVALAVFLYEFVRLIIYAALPAPLFIFCLAGTLKALPAATSVPTEEKRRIVGTLVLLLLNYFLINLPAVILLTLNSYSPYPEILHPEKATDFIIIIFFLFSSLLDFILFAFMCKGPIDRLLARLCCCSMESNNTGDGAGEKRKKKERK